MLQLARTMIMVSVVVCGVLSAGAQATVWNVTNLSEFRTAMGAVNPGDVIQVQYGVYQVTASSDPKHWFKRAGTVSDPIQIVGVLDAGGNRPVFDATGTAIDRGIFYIWPYYPNYVIENLEFRNSRGGGNASAAYIRASNVTFRNCYSHHNDDGWFSTDGAENTVLEFCETAYNGNGSGYSHNYYVNSDSMTVRANYIRDSVGGQNFKSRCKHLVFEDNFMERDGNYTWEIASNNVDNTLMIGNVIIKGTSAANNRIIGLSDGTSTNASTGTLTMINNTVVSTSSYQLYFFSHSVAGTNLVLYNNIFTGPSTNLWSWAGSGTRTGSHNWFQTGMYIPAGITDSTVGSDPAFVDPSAKDYHLLPGSACRDAGNNVPQWLNRYDVWETRVPDAEYVLHLQTTLRPVDSTLDIGAYEYPIPMPALAASEPAADGTLPKTQNNVILLTFDAAIALPDGGAPALSIFGGGLEEGNAFTYSIEPDGVTLKAVEQGPILTDQTWYVVTPAPGFDVEAFSLDLCAVFGDANNSGRVTTADYSEVKGHMGEYTDARYDLNGSGRVTTADYSVVKSNMGQRAPTKP